MAHQSSSALAKEANAPIATTSATYANNNANAGILYPQLESTVAPLDNSDKYDEIVKIERELVNSLRETVNNQANSTTEHLLKDVSQDVKETRIFPLELIVSSSKIIKKKIKVDLTERLRKLPTNDEVEDEEGELAEDEEVSDEEAMIDEDEDEDAGGDYGISHFDNGEGFEDNDDDGDELGSMM